jgi:hypothetical protein
MSTRTTRTTRLSVRFSVSHSAAVLMILAFPVNGALAITLQQATDLGNLFNLTAPSNWTSIRENITMLTSPTSVLLEFDGFNGTTPVKQADVVLLTYPFERERSDVLALQDLDFYRFVLTSRGSPLPSLFVELTKHLCSLATSPNGPGMTYSVFSIIAAELSPSGCASYSCAFFFPSLCSRRKTAELDDEWRRLPVECEGVTETGAAGRAAEKCCD